MFSHKSKGWVKPVIWIFKSLTNLGGRPLIHLEYRDRMWAFSILNKISDSKKRVSLFSEIKLAQDFNNLNSSFAIFALHDAILFPFATTASGSMKIVFPDEDESWIIPLNLLIKFTFIANTGLPTLSLIIASWI